MAKCKVNKGSDGERFFLTSPGGVDGDVFMYGELATVTDNNEDEDVYICRLSGPSATPQVERIERTRVVACDVEEVEIEDDEEDETCPDCGQLESDCTCADATPVV